MTYAGRILVVCTGNVCRSPYLAYRLAQELDGTGIIIGSAGTRALADRPMEPGSASELLNRGVDGSSFIARQLVPEMIAEADMYIGLAREHRSSGPATFAKSLRYAFTLTQLSDLTAALGKETIAAAPGANRVAQVASAAMAARADVPPRSAEESDIIDPFRQGPEVFAQMAVDIDRLLPPIVAALRS